MGRGTERVPRPAPPPPVRAPGAPVGPPAARAPTRTAPRPSAPAGPRAPAAPVWAPDPPAGWVPAVPADCQGSAPPTHPARRRPAPAHSSPGRATPRRRTRLPPRPSSVGPARPSCRRPRGARSRPRPPRHHDRPCRPAPRAPVGRLALRTARGRRRPGPGRPLPTDTHAAGGSDDGQDGGGQADRYVQGAHEATSGRNAGSDCPTPATRKRTRRRHTGDTPVTYP